MCNYIYITSEDGIRSATSKGDQLKWGVDNNWIKADTYGYEGLSEYITSRFLDCTNIEHVRYQITNIYDEITRKTYNGCICRNMYNHGEEFITFARILDKSNQYDRWKKIESSEDKIVSIIEIIENICGYNVLDYITETLYVDQLICNEDRHLNNLGLIREKDRRYKPGVIFDNGMSLFARDSFWGDIPVKIAIRKIRYMPFGNNQIKVLQKLNPEYRVRVDLEKWEQAKIKIRTVKEYRIDTIAKCLGIIDNRLSVWRGKLWEPI